MSTMTTVAGASPKGRLVYSDLDEKRGYEIEGKPTTPKFSATLVFDAEVQKTPEYQALDKGVNALVSAKFGKRPLPPKFWNPIRSVDEKVNKDGLPLSGFDVPGGKWMKFATAYEFEAYGPLNERITDPAEIKKLFYNGCFVRVVYEAKLYDAGGGGVALYLAKIKKVGDGPRLGGTSEASGIEFGEDDIGDTDPMA